MRKTVTKPAPPNEEQTTFNARLPKRMKNTLERAAELRGQSLTEFILGSAYERAVQTIASENVLQLSERDSSAFASALAGTAVVDDAVVARFLEAHRRSRK